MRTYFDQFAKKLVAAMRFGEPSAIWTSEAVHLSAASAALIEGKLQALRLEVRHMAEAERDLPSDEKLWYSLLLLAYRHDIMAPGDPLGWAFTPAP